MNPEEMGAQFRGTQGMNHTQRRTAQARAAAPPANKKKPSRAKAKRDWKRKLEG